MPSPRTPTSGLEVLANILAKTGLYRPVQGDLPLGVPDASVKRQLMSLVPSTEGVTYAFPRAQWGAAPWQRQQLRQGLIQPLHEQELIAKQAADATPWSNIEDAFKKEADKARAGSRLAQRVSEFGLPSAGSVMRPRFDMLAYLNGNQGADAAAAFRGPEWTGNPNIGFLDDLIGGTTKGSGGKLLSHVLSDPAVMPDVDKFIYTPLPGARPFYEKQFGAEYMPLRDVTSDPDSDIYRAIDNLGEWHNADLGVGVIHRAGGGVVPKAALTGLAALGTLAGGDDAQAGWPGAKVPSRIGELMLSHFNPADIKAGLAPAWRDEVTGPGQRMGEIAIRNAATRAGGPNSPSNLITAHDQAGHLVGAMHVSIPSDRSATIEALGAWPPRSGIGGQMLDYLRSQMPDATVRATAEHSVVPFYNRHGMEAVGTTPWSPDIFEMESRR